MATQKSPRKAPRKPTTTVRISVDTHGDLMEIAEQLNLTTDALIEKLLRHYRAKLRHQAAARQLREMKKDPEVWADFLGGEEHWPELDRLRAQDKK